MRPQGILRSEPDLSDSLHPFRERLAETVAWCQRMAVPEKLGASLRTAALAPPPAMQWPETVRAVAESRLLQLGRSWRRTLDPLGGGQLLIYYPTPPHSRGAAQKASREYLDHRDTPPWDTWVAYVEEQAQSYLVTWVPAEAMQLIVPALKTPRVSLGWLDGSDVMLSDRLKAGQPG
jgi:hypothetical protein